MTASTRYTEVAIIGAGPAGMAAANRLSEAGLSPVVFDLAPNPGGQIYRQLSAPQVGRQVMGPDYLHGQGLIERFAHSRADYRPGSRVWWAKRENQGVTLGVLQAGHSDAWQARRLIIASGAMERGWPFPGWQLPGVMQAGAGQILLKQGALVPDSAPILAGSGPLLYLLAWQYLRAGCPPRLVLDSAPRSRYVEVMKRPQRAWLGRRYLTKGLRMMIALKRAGVPIRQGLEALQAEGSTHLQALRYRVGGEWRRCETDLLLTHFGVVPEPQLGRGLGLAYDWHTGQQAFVPQRDTALRAEEGIWLAGDGGAIGGALNAEREGQLAALSVLEEDGAQVGAERKAVNRARQGDLAVRPLLEALFRVPEAWLGEQPGHTLVCRCESVSLEQITTAMAQGAAGPNQLKAFTRCGMGPCQGRLCGESVSRLMAGHLGTTPDAVGYYRIRPPLQSITLGELTAPTTEPASS